MRRWRSFLGNFPLTSILIFLNMFPNSLKLSAMHCWLISLQLTAWRGSSIGCAAAWYADGHGFDPQVRQNILSSRFGHEKISTTILSLPLMQEGQVSVTSERMGSKYW